LPTIIYIIILSLEELESSLGLAEARERHHTSSLGALETNQTIVCTHMCVSTADVQVHVHEEDRSKEKRRMDIAYWYFNGGVVEM
jgi:hypothetical protein